MGLITNAPSFRELGKTNAYTTKTKPTAEGQRVEAVKQQEESTSMFGWLDDLGSTLNKAAGGAVEVYDKYIKTKEINSRAETTSDQTPALPVSNAQIVTDGSFMGMPTKTLIIVGAVGALALVGFLVMRGK